MSETVSVINPTTSEKLDKVDLATGVNDILSLVDSDREKEIITRRFGLNAHKETLEQIGELLGITRERVRQLEKSIVAKLKSAVENGKTNSVVSLEKTIIRLLSERGRVARISELADAIYGRPTTPVERANVAFLAELAPGLTVIDENDNYYHSVAIAEYGDARKVKAKIDDIVAFIKEKGEPVSIDEAADALDYEHPSFASAIAGASKQLATLGGKWGLVKWPTVNPKNIRDKIYVILAENGKPMHFSDIAGAIRGSNFKRKDVTTQAIHNELIKDKRFVLIGRGIYALESWGYSKGTVSDIITNILKNAGAPLHRDEIVKQVLASRQVKETTILLNLQSRPEFKRVAKATYTLNA